MESISYTTLCNPRSLRTFYYNENIDKSVIAECNTDFNKITPLDLEILAENCKEVPAWLEELLNKKAHSMLNKGQLIKLNRQYFIVTANSDSLDVWCLLKNRGKYTVKIIASYEII